MHYSVVRPCAGLRFSLTSHSDWSRLWLLGLIAACLSSNFLDASAADSQRSLQVEGGGDAPGLGREARRNAMVNARNRLLLNHLEFWSGSTDLAKLAPILDRGETYFRDVRLLRHEPNQESTHVEIKAELLLSNLRSDIAKYILPSLDRKPTALVIMHDDFGNDDVRAMAESGVAEKKLRKILRNAGITVIDPERVRKALTAEELLACVGGAESLSAEAARSLFADIVIVGRATVSVAEDSRVTNLFRNRGSVAIRIVRASDDAIAEELHATGVVESREPTVGGPMAVEDACEKLSVSLASGVIMAVLFSPDDDAVKLLVIGHPKDGLRDDVIKWLANQANVDAVEIVGMEEGLVRLRLDYSGEMNELVRLLEDGASLRIKRVFGKSVTAEF